jgi:hypothetical protein
MGCRVPRAGRRWTCVAGAVLIAALPGTGCGGSSSTSSLNAAERKQDVEAVRNGPPPERRGALFARGCDARVGDGRLSPTRHDLVLRNARLYFVGQHAPIRMGSIFKSGKRMRGKWRAFKMLVILNGAEATLRVPPRDRRNFLLAYDLARVKNVAYLRSDGQGAVRFVNCLPPRRNLEFAGSLIARRPGCYRLQEVSKDGEVAASGVVNIAMGRGVCGEHPQHGS